MILREAVANLRSRGLLHLTTSILASSCLFASGALVMADTDQIVDYQRSLAQAGYYVLSVAPTDQGPASPIRAEVCHRLAETPPFLGGSTMESRSDIAVPNGRGVRLNAWAADPSLLDLVSRFSGADAQSFVSPLVFDDDLGLTLADIDSKPRRVGLVVGDEELVIGGSTSDLGIMGAGFEGAALFASLGHESDVCILFARRTARQAAFSTAATAFPASDGFRLSWALPSPMELVDPEERYQTRSSRYSWLAGALGAILVSIGWLRIRLRDYAAYKLFGLPAARLAALVRLEAIMLLTPALAAAGVGLWVAGSLVWESGEVRSSVLAACGSSLLVAIAVAGVSREIAVMDPLKSLRD